MGHVVGYFYGAILMGIVLLVYAAVAAKPGAIVAGLALIAIGGILAAVTRRVDD